MEKTMSEFIIPKEKTVCFSGHRPEKLPDGATQTVIDNINTLFPDEDSAMTSGYAGPVIGNFDSFLYDVTEEDADADADSAGGEETE